MSQNDLLGRLCVWYMKQCDGQWEHEQGINITTVDNPGWRVRINLRGTAAENSPLEKIVWDRGGSDWLRCFKENGQFVGAGDPSKLPVILEQFLKFVDEV